LSTREIYIVLTGPQGARNIGAVGRAMMNFGVSALRLVRPEADHLGDEARHMAVRAGRVLTEARVFDDLAAAVADCHLVFGTTRRFGKYREDFLSPRQAAILVGEQAMAVRIALVFGREDSGLTTAELDCCHHLLTIPTSAALPSMNLSHAVAICLYEMFSRLPTTASPGQAGVSTPAAAAGVAAMFAHMRQSLAEIGFLNPKNPDHILRAFRRMFGRAGLSTWEVTVLQGLWSRLDWLNNELRKGKN